MFVHCALNNFNRLNLWFVTLDHKTSHKGQFFEIEIYTSSENLESEGAKKYKYWEIHL